MPVRSSRRGSCRADWPSFQNLRCIRQDDPALRSDWPCSPPTMSASSASFPQSPLRVGLGAACRQRHGTTVEGAGRIYDTCLHNALGKTFDGLGTHPVPTPIPTTASLRRRSCSSFWRGFKRSPPCRWWISALMPVASLNGFQVVVINSLSTIGACRDALVPAPFEMPSGSS